MARIKVGHEKGYRLILVILLFFQKLLAFSIPQSKLNADC